MYHWFYLFTFTYWPLDMWDEQKKRGKKKENLKLILLLHLIVQYIIYFYFAFINYKKKIRTFFFKNFELLNNGKHLSLEKLVGWFYNMLTVVELFNAKICMWGTKWLLDSFLITPCLGMEKLKKKF